MGAPRKPFDVTAAIREYNDGASLKEIAEAQNVRPATVASRLREQNVQIRARGGRRDKAVAETMPDGAVPDLELEPTG